MQTINFAIPFQAKNKMKVPSFFFFLGGSISCDLKLSDIITKFDEILLKAVYIIPIYTGANFCMQVLDQAGCKLDD